MTSVVVASEINRPSNTIQVQRLVSPAFAENTAAAASENPTNPLPTSPMKIRAEGKFQQRNPAADPASAYSANLKLSSSPPIPTRTAPALDTNTACAAANPSIPSMKLNELIDQTIPTAPTTHPNHPKSTGPAGELNGAKPPVAVNTTIAASRCIPARTGADRPRISSTKPAPATPVVAAKRPTGG